ncbi:hypothetical protein BC777_1782 [Yoonia maricola]|uniref:Uncharacterized protein n=1 Tax=Yoonia maricola TaxID=420999 RepID=A0A2M8WPQ7_9RHOB|nr:hypothetical protein [Yoonia maricola]PJI92917.1 hypothetical protein BC777_1782 [Yoonia maricola]
MTYHTHLDVRARRHKGGLLLLRGPVAMQLSASFMQLWHLLARRTQFDNAVVHDLCDALKLDRAAGDKLVQTLLEKGFVATALADDRVDI